MNAEGSRDPERFVFQTVLPKGMSRSWAEQFFREQKKAPPHILAKYEKFLYDPKTGFTRVV